MSVALGTANNPIRRQAGAGEVRERTIVIDSQVIVVDNIGSIAIVAAGRSWWLANLGLVLLVAGGVSIWFGEAYATWFGALGPRNTGLSALGLGGALVLLNLVLPPRRGLGIGTTDGGATIIVSKDETFLQRLLTLLIEKVDTRNEGLTARFDIANARFTPGSARPVVGLDMPPPRPELMAEKRAPAPVVTSSAPLPEAVAAANLELESEEQADETLFSDDAGPPQQTAEAEPRVLKPLAPNSPTPTLAALKVEGPPQAPRDPLLDGPLSPGPYQDWLDSSRAGVTRGSVARSSEEDEGGAARWLIPTALLLVTAAGAFAAWYYVSQQGAASSVSLIAAAPVAPIETTPATLEAIPAPLAATEATPSRIEPTTGDAPPIEPAAAPAATPQAADPVPPPITAFSPDQPIVARSSGQRYRAEPSSADDVAVLGETRSGGELLAVDAFTRQADGDWYRLTLADGRAAWIKASLTVPRARFADTFRTYAQPGLPFAASSPGILEPAEGVQLPGGPQPVRLAWAGPEEANLYFVEIESFDASSRRWVDEPGLGRQTVESADELGVNFPRAGFWRWRVRGVSAAGEQTQFSRWAAFGIRN